MKGFLVISGESTVRRQRLERTQLGDALLAAEAARGVPDSHVLCAEIDSSGNQWTMSYTPPRPLFLRGRFYMDKGRDGRPDIDLALDAYRSDGVGGLAVLNGEFSLCLIDLQAVRLVALVDGFGTRGLYWIALPELTAVSDSCSALIALFRPWLTLNDPVIASALVPFATSCRSSGETFYREIRRIRTGERLTVPLSSRLAPAIEHATFPNWLLAGTRLGLSECQRQFAKALRESVADRMGEAAAPLALSGGLDSSALAVAMRQACAFTRGRRLLAYTADFGALHPNEEAALAARTARTLAIEHSVLSREHEQYHFPCATSVPWADDPMGLTDDLSVLRALERHGSPVFIGVGADEAFAASRRRPGLRPTLLARLRGRLRREWRRWRGATLQSGDPELQALLACGVPAWVRTEWHASLAPAGSDLRSGGSENRTWYDVLQGPGLQSDVEGMDCDGLWRPNAALPFLDHRVLRICLSPAVGRLELSAGGQGRQKQLIRRYLRPYLPGAVSERPKKPAGHFAVSIARRKGEQLRLNLKDSAHPLLAYLDPSALPDLSLDSDWAAIYPHLAVLSVASWFHWSTGVEKWIKFSKTA